MNRPHHAVDRRRFLQGSLAATAAVPFAAGLLTPQEALVRGQETSAQPSSGRPDGVPKVCAFIKFVQSYGYDELAERTAEAGFDGIEATVRRGGYIEPLDAEEKLPKLVEALAERGQEITVLCTDVLRIDQPHAESLLRTAAGLGIRQYRMGFYRYDLSRPILAQLEALRPGLSELAELNRELGLQAVYQNHSGANYVGGPLWDVHRLIEDLPVDAMALAYDIRHATIEGGLTWPLTYKLVRPHIGAVFVKDFDWVGRRVRHVPLGDGRVDPQFFAMLQEDGFHGPYSVHVEYLGDRDADENMQALQRDLAVLRRWLAAARG